ncbi:MAG: YhdP family protein [Methylotetracoccus sp.]
MTPKSTPVRWALGALAPLMLLVAAGLSTVRFWLLPRLEHQRADIEQRLGRVVDERIQIGALQARMNGFAPELSLGDVRILDSAGVAGVRFDQIRLGVDPLRTILTGQLAPAWLVIRGTKLSLRRKPDGGFTVLGLNISDRPPAWLLAARTIELLDTRIDWQDLRSGGPMVELGRADLRMMNEGDRHQLSATTVLPGADGAPIRLAMDAHGDLFSAEHWNGRIYLAVDGQRVEGLADLLPPTPRLLSGTVSLKLWSAWDAGAVHRVAGHVDLLDAVIAETEANPSAPNMPPARVDTWFRWQRQADRSTIDLSGLRVALRGEPASPVRLSLAVESGDGGAGATWRGRASRLNLRLLSELSHDTSLLPDDVRRWLVELSPRGELRDVAFVWRPGDSVRERLYVCAELQDVGISASGAAPGWTNLAGRICGTEQSGQFDLRAANGAISLPRLLDAPLQCDRVQFKGQWQWSSGAWTLATEQLSVTASDLDVAGHLNVHMDDASSDSPLIDLGLRIGEMPVTAALRLLPRRLVPKTARFLDAAMRQGRIVRAELQFKGRSGDFPFREHNGSFEAMVEGKGVELAYDPGWPALRELDATLKFTGPTLRIDASSGRVGEGRILGARGVIEDLDRTPRLILDGQVRADVPAVLGFLAQSPLRRFPSALLQFADAAGDADIDLHLGVPLDDGAFELRGDALLRNGSLSGKRFPLAIRGVHGTVSIGPDGISAKALSGTFAGRPVTITAGQHEGSTRIAVAGRAAVADLRDWLPDALAERLRGEGALEAIVDIPDGASPGDQPARISVRSDLQGIALAAPAPFGKPAASRVDAAMQVEFGPQTSGLHVSVGQDLLASFVLRDGPSGRHVESGAVAWRRALPRGSLQSGLTLLGHFDRLDLREWPDPVPGGNEINVLGRVRSVEFDAQDVVMKGGSTGPLNLRLVRDGARWTGFVDGEAASGEFRWASSDEGPGEAQFDLNFLKLPLLRGGTNGTVAPSLDPRRLPTLKGRSRKVLWQGSDLGRLDVDAERHDTGLMLRKFDIGAAGRKLSMSGDWLAVGAAPRVRLNGRMNIDSIGDLAKQWGYPGRVLDTKADLRFRLEWPGSPFRFDPVPLQGEIDVDLGEGSLLEVEPGWGRVIGFLNLNSIWRRLSLDFRDLFGKGLAYDGIKGQFKLADGKATTDGLLIEGVATRIVLQGRTDFVRKQLDQTMTIIPRTTAALPLAGTIAGGPAVGAAIYVAQELIGEQVDSITASQYSVRGDWSNPRVEKLSSNAPLDLLNKAWSGLQNWSGSTNESEDTKR